MKKYLVVFVAAFGVAYCLADDQVSNQTARQYQQDAQYEVQVEYPSGASEPVMPGEDISRACYLFYTANNRWPGTFEEVKEFINAQKPVEFTITVIAQDGTASLLYDLGRYTKVKFTLLVDGWLGLSYVYTFGDYQGELFEGVRIAPPGTIFPDEMKSKKPGQDGISAH